MSSFNMCIFICFFQKLHFQQLCRDMKAKREAFKNPTRETLTKLVCKII